MKTIYTRQGCEVLPVALRGFIVTAIRLEDRACRQYHISGLRCSSFEFDQIAVLPLPTKKQDEQAGGFVIY